VREKEREKQVVESSKRGGPRSRAGAEMSIASAWMAGATAVTLGLTTMYTSGPVRSREQREADARQEEASAYDAQRRRSIEVLQSERRAQQMMQDDHTKGSYAWRGTFTPGASYSAHMGRRSSFDNPVGNAGDAPTPYDYLYRRYGVNEFIKGMGAAFRRADADGNGRLSKQELAAALDTDPELRRLLALRGEAGKKEVGEVFTAMDKDKSGEVDFSEFMQYVSQAAVHAPASTGAVTA
jgi:hypothetical protein